MACWNHDRFRYGCVQCETPPPVSTPIDMTRLEAVGTYDARGWSERAEELKGELRRREERWLQAWRDAAAELGITDTAPTVCPRTLAVGRAALGCALATLLIALLYPLIGSAALIFAGGAALATAGSLAVALTCDAGRRRQMRERIAVLAPIGFDPFDETDAPPPWTARDEDEPAAIIAALDELQLAIQNSPDRVALLPPVWAFWPRISADSPPFPAQVLEVLQSFTVEAAERSRMFVIETADVAEMTETTATTEFAPIPEASALRA
jgi:hypothetical protein